MRWFYAVRLRAKVLYQNDRQDRIKLCFLHKVYTIDFKLKIVSLFLKPRRLSSPPLILPLFHYSRALGRRIDLFFSEFLFPRNQLQRLRLISTIQE